MIKRTHDIGAYFSDFPREEAKLAEAFKVAVQIRNLEYDLYWKRTGFGWLIVAAAFTAFLALQEKGDFATRYGLACLGFVFSFAWYLMNRASASWARNWEVHVEILEDKVIGPLFKSVMNRRAFDSIDLLLPFPFSPQRINNILSLTIAGLWLFFMVRTCANAKPQPISFPHWSISFVLLTTLTIAAMCCLWFKARVSNPEKYQVLTDREVREFGSKKEKYYPSESVGLWKRLWRTLKC